MADYIYLLQNRLTRSQQNAIEAVRGIAKSHNMTVFLVGGAVRDLTSGAPVRDIDIAVQGSALTLRNDLLSAGGVVTGESKLMDALYLNFPGGVRAEVGSTIVVTYPKPGKPAVEHAPILDDLRRRDFTANAMAISLNEGSFGLLMDPMNGVADIENMELRLVSNYGFIEDPARMIRAARLSSRLGWHMEEKTRQRYDAGKEEGYISAMSQFQQGYETEEIFHEEDPLTILEHLEAEGWSKHLFPALSPGKINSNDLNRLRDIVGQLELAGIYPDPSPAYYPILTAKLAAKDVEALNKSFARPGFVEQAHALDAETKTFATQFTGKSAAAPSEAWKLLTAAVPEQVLWLTYSSKSAPVQARLKAFLTEWPQARNHIPYQLMQEMRITPDLPGYDELIEKLFFAIMDGKLDTPEAARAYLEPYSPPAPPPPVNLRRRAVKRESKAGKPRKKEKTQEVTLAAEASETPAEQPVTAPAPAPAPAKVVKSERQTKPVVAPKPVSKGKPVTTTSEKKRAVSAKVAAKEPVLKKSSPAKSVPAKKAVAKKMFAKSASPARSTKKNAPKPKKKAASPQKSTKAPARQGKTPKKQAVKKSSAKTSPAAKKKAPVAKKSAAKKAAAKTKSKSRR